MASLPATLAAHGPRQRKSAVELSARARAAASMLRSARRSPRLVEVVARREADVQHTEPRTLEASVPHRRRTAGVQDRGSEVTQLECAQPHASGQPVHGGSGVGLSIEGPAGSTGITPRQLQSCRPERACVSLYVCLSRISHSKALSTLHIPLRILDSSLEWMRGGA